MKNSINWSILTLKVFCQRCCTILLNNGYRYPKRSNLKMDTMNSFNRTTTTPLLHKDTSFDFWKILPLKRIIHTTAIIYICVVQGLIPIVKYFFKHTHCICFSFLFSSILYPYWSQCQDKKLQTNQWFKKTNHIINYKIVNRYKYRQKKHKNNHTLNNETII